MSELERKQKIEKLEQARDAIRRYKIERNKVYFENTLKFSIIWAPTILGVVGSICYFKSVKRSPFILDYVEKQAYVTESYSSNTGVVEKHVDYVVKKSPMDSDVLFYYGPWTEQDDGTYLCTTTKYILNDIAIEQAEKLFSKEDLSFDDVSILSVQNSEVTNFRKNSITKEELEMEPYFEIKIYGFDKKDTVIAKETEKENDDSVGILAAIGIASGICEICAYVIAKCIRALPYSKACHINRNIKKYKEEEKRLIKQVSK